MAQYGFVRTVECTVGPERETHVSIGSRPVASYRGHIVSGAYLADGGTHEIFVKLSDISQVR